MDGRSECLTNRYAIFNTPTFSPELMVASDLTAGEIRKLAEKFGESEDKKWTDAIYLDRENMELFRCRISPFFAINLFHVQCFL